MMVRIYFIILLITELIFVVSGFIANNFDRAIDHIFVIMALITGCMVGWMLKKWMN